MTKITRVILLRHGETEWNLKGWIQGTTDIELTENGIEQANEAKERLRGKYDYIFTSPLKRAHKTAMIINEQRTDNLFVKEELRELSFGEWEGRTFEELNDEQYLKFEKGIDGMPLDHTGTSVELEGIKNKEFILKMCKEYEGKKLIFVSHGAWIKSTIIALLDLKVKNYHNLSSGNTGITV